MVERARAKWEDEPKYPAHERPAPPARRRNRRAAGGGAGWGCRGRGGPTAAGDAEAVLRPRTLVAGRRETLDRNTQGEEHRDSVSSPCTAIYATLFAFQALRSQDASVGEYVAEAQAFRQLHQRLPMLVVGSDPAFSPTPYGVAIGPQAAGDLRPRQAGFLLEPHEPLWEVVGEVVGSSSVVIALSRHGAQDPLGAQPATLSNASAGIAFRVGPRPWALPVRVGYACLTRPSICAGFSCCPLLARPGDDQGAGRAGDVVVIGRDTPTSSAIPSPVTVASRRSRSACSSLPRPGRPTPARSTSRSPLA